MVWVCSALSSKRNKLIAVIAVVVLVGAGGGAASGSIGDRGMGRATGGCAMRAIVLAAAVTALGGYAIPAVDGGPPGFDEARYAPDLDSCRGVPALVGLAIA